MNHLHPIILAMLLLGGCVSTYTLPEDYEGATATIVDSYEYRSNARAYFYFVSHIDGQAIANAATSSSSASSGNGLRLTLFGSERAVPVQPLNLKLIAQPVGGAPIIDLLNTGKNYSKELDITFTPTPGEFYVVKGELAEDTQLVWLEDSKGVIVAGDDTDENVVTQPPSRADLLRLIAQGESASMVKARLGPPDSITHEEGNFWQERLPTTTYRYEGLGSVVFDKYARGTLWARSARVFTPRGLSNRSQPIAPNQADWVSACNQIS